MKRVLKWLDVNFEPVCMVVLFYSLLCLITVEVILRFLFGGGLSWSEEISRYLFVWLIYFSISYATRNNRHIRVSMLQQMLPNLFQRVILMLSDLFFLSFSGVLFVATWVVCAYNEKVGNRAITVNVSINILYMAGVVGFLLMFIRLVQNIVWKIRHWSAPLEVYENFEGKYFPDNELCFALDGDKQKMLSEEGGCNT
ncbi:TRAP transporter small permease [Anaerotruncus rubiinfantis]|uniref:TRAP transporter small permease n=1 Tax=Anaerotruncus rubiinfantis TaxID=1720200 RepID=UPI0034A16726